ncbi:hypothetical protein [Pseudomonas sp. B21-028]|uniref:hypothetical protein n=1 Tax=Pseudomonas sp. B21-028 TaxID=2895480 RepID=UPI002852E6B6|nr:hypothetical protein [Pseudomonas sp. B21-028]
MDRVRRHSPKPASATDGSGVIQAALGLVDSARCRYCRCNCYFITTSATKRKIYEAHRIHAYQFASHQYGRHLPVTAAVASINMFWLLPLAACVVLWNVDRMLALIIAYVPSVLLAVSISCWRVEKA